MKVLLLGLGNAPSRFHFASIHCENYVERRMDGHEILTFGYNEGVDIRIRPEDDFSKVVDQLPGGWLPDCCVLWEVDWSLLPRGIETTPFPTVAVAWDWDYDVPLTKAIIDATHISLVFSETERVAFSAMGADARLYYAIGIMEKYFNENPTPIAKREYDIIYTTPLNDATDAERSRLVRTLAGLAGRHRIAIHENMPFADYVELLRNAKVVLSHHRHNSMSGRILDAAAQGTVVVDTGRETSRHFVPGVEYISVADEDLSEQIQRYLDDGDGLQKMADRVRAKVVGDFEARKRFVGMLGYLESELRTTGLKRNADTLSPAERLDRSAEAYFYSFFRSTSWFVMNTGGRLLDLSLEQFARAARLEPTPRRLTNRAIAKMARGFLHNPQDCMKGEGREAGEILHDVARRHRDYAMAQYQLGLLYMRAGEAGEAREAFRHALSLFEDDRSDVDPWCLHNRDFSLFNDVLRRPLNDSLLALCAGSGAEGSKAVRLLFQASVLYFSGVIELGRARIRSALSLMMESHRRYAGLDVVTVKVAQLLAMLGQEKESLAMYKEAVTRLPWNMELRNEFIKTLYVWGQDEGVMREVKDVLRLATVVIPLQKKTPLIRETMNGFSRYNGGAHGDDACKQAVVTQWIEGLCSAVTQAPGDGALVMRLASLWLELGRADKMVDAIESYAGRSCENTPEEMIRVLGKGCEDLEKIASRGQALLKQLQEKGGGAASRERLSGCLGAGR